MRLGILLTHPIQYYAPLFRHLARRLDLEVFYAHRQDGKGQAAAGFGVEFEWDIPLLEGYSYRWLDNVATRPNVNAFYGCDTPEIYQILREEHFDAFLVFGWYYKSALQAALGCWRNGIPLMMRGDSQLNTPRSWIKSLLKYLPYRLVLPRVHAHLYVGQRNKAYLQHYGVPESRLFFAPHFVDNDWFRHRAGLARPKRTALRAQFGANDDTLVLLFAGKFLPDKRPLDLIEAASLLCKEGVDVCVVYVGAGPLESELREAAAQTPVSVNFAGFKNQTELPAYYVSADLLVLPSEGSETWGLVVNEAMACGLPAVVSHDVGCGPDLIESECSGAVFATGDIAGLAEAVQKVRPYLGTDRLQRALRAKMAYYSVEVMAEGILKAIDAHALSPSVTGPDVWLHEASEE